MRVTIISEETKKSIISLIDIVSELRLEEGATQLTKKISKRIKDGLAENNENNSLKTLGTESIAIVKIAKGKHDIPDNKPRLPVFRTEELANASMIENKFDPFTHKIIKCKIVYLYENNQD